MMKPFIHQGFLFTGRRGEKLYHDFAVHLPVIDFHSHLSPAMISADSQFENITQAWLEGDHYKWRAMRINGVSEKYCTGDAKPEEKFLKWAATVPATAGNPLYHWTHLELSRYFGIETLLSPVNAPAVYEKCSSLLRTKEFSVRSLLKKMNAELVCTTDDPTDSLEFHRELQRSFDIRILPTFRPDNAIATDDPVRFSAWVKKLSAASGKEINNLAAFIEALDSRHEFFNKIGCKLSDHGLERMWFLPVTDKDADKTFSKLLKEKSLTADEAEGFRTVVMRELCLMNHKRGWAQQFHLGALRNNNKRMFLKMGADTGWDSIARNCDPAKISGFLNMLDENDRLARTILYNLNPADNAMMLTMAGNFCDGSTAGKIQYGPAWWFLDQKNGIEQHLRDLSSFSLLGRFVGMVTDSRSFLSFPRHEYFRRIACNFIGEEVEKGLIPDDEGLLRQLVEGICCNNAKEFFGLL
jgi:glucuronate isomerase